MRRTGWLVVACLAASALLGVACGLSTSGLEDTGGDSAAPGNDATADMTTTFDTGGGVDAATGDVATESSKADAFGDAPSPHDAQADSMPPPQDGGACKGSPTSCGSPGKCVDCTSSGNGAACVGGACGCNGPKDCPAGNACQGNKTCGSACGTGQSACNGSCCSLFSCVAFDNNHCGGACAPCGGQTPTCGANGMCNDSCGGTGDGTCQMSCCNAGHCAGVGNQTCGDWGASCVACSITAGGANCELVGINFQCGCDGPNHPEQCPTGNACYNMQCGATCDAQHPCNGGCCSGNSLLTSTCVAACSDGGMCMGGVCP